MQFDSPQKEQYVKAFTDHLRKSGMVIIHVNQRTQAILDAYEEVIGQEGTWQMINEAIEERVPEFVAFLEKFKGDDWERHTAALKAALATPKA